MKRSLLKCLAVIVLAASAVGAAPPSGATIPLYENWGTSGFGTNAPIVDALAFANYGLFDPSDIIPFDFQNTINFTNRQTMRGSPGFLIETASPSTGPRRAGTFFNAVPNATVSGTEIVHINATNIINRGNINSPATGVLHLEGVNIDLRSSTVDVDPVAGTGSANGTTSFLPDTAIFDLYWGTTNETMNLSMTFPPNSNGGVDVQTPGTPVNTRGGGGFQRLSLLSPITFVYTNAVTPTNWIVQGVFIGLSDTNYGASVGFYPSVLPTNYFVTPRIRISMSATNPVTDSPIVNDLFITDTTASYTNFTLLVNATESVADPGGPYYRPYPFIVSRINTGGNGAARSANAAITTNLFWNQIYSNRFVTNIFAAYACKIDSIAAPLQSFEPTLGAPGNPLSAGRVEIVGDNVDLTKARLRGEGLLSITAKNLLSTTNAIVDTQGVSLDLGAGSGNVKVQNLNPEVVARMQGQIYLWSGVWTNYLETHDTNMVVGPDPMDTNVPPAMVTNTVVTTNAIEVGFAATVVDAYSMRGRVPVTIRDITLRATNSVVIDNLDVTGGFQALGDSLTLKGRLNLAGGQGILNDWFATNAPNLRFLTNSGTLSVPNLAYFGSDRVKPYDAIVNTGTNNSTVGKYYTDYFENGGRINTSGRLVISATTAKMDTGSSVSGGDVDLMIGDLKMRNYTLNTTAGLNLWITNSWSDIGVGSSNTVISHYGFHLNQKPATGALLGTVFQTTAPRFSLIEHTWSAVDRGATKDGFVDNAAIGKLQISSGTGGSLTFKGTGTGNAMYVDYLDISTTVSADLEGTLLVDPDFTIYFADSNIPAQQLDGALGGRLRWVRDFAGPFSGVDVALGNGKIVRVNRAFRNSLSIDSDGDGIPNALDNSLFDGSKLSIKLVRTPNTAFQVTFTAAAGTAYTVEYTTSLTNPNWQVYQTLTNESGFAGTLTITDDTVPAGDSQRYYRVRYNPPF